MAVETRFGGVDPGVVEQGCVKRAVSQSNWRGAAGRVDERAAGPDPDDEFEGSEGDFAGYLAAHARRRGMRM